MNLIVKKLKSIDVGCEALIAKAQEFDSMEEARDLVSAAMKELDATSKMCRDIMLASESLEQCGFTDEWLKVVNADGNMGQIVDFDKPAFFGGVDAKKTACLEGFKDALIKFLKWSWDQIQKIWDAIMKLISKVYDSFVGAQVKKETKASYQYDILMAGSKAFDEHIYVEMYDPVGLEKHLDILHAFAKTIQLMSADTGKVYTSDSHDRGAFMTVFAARLANQGLNIADVCTNGVKLVPDGVQFTDLKELIEKKKVFIPDSGDIIKHIEGPISTSLCALKADFGSIMNTLKVFIKTHSAIVNAQFRAEQSVAPDQLDAARQSTNNEINAIDEARIWLRIVEKCTIRANEIGTMIRISSNNARTSYAEAVRKFTNP